MARLDLLLAVCALLASGGLPSACAHTRTVRREPPPVPPRFDEPALPPVALTAPAAPQEKTRPEGLVARLGLRAPDHSPFVLHGTIPVPPGFSPLPGGRSPFGVVSHGDGREVVPAQVEIVSRYPDGQPDVIEILALVELGAGEAAGTPVGFDVVVHDAGQGADAPRRTPDTIFDQPLLLRTRDVHGNTYALDLRGDPDGAGFGSTRVVKHGAAVTQTRTYGTLVPIETSGEGAPLPHLMGVHAYVTHWAGDGRVTLEVRVNNGAIAGSAEPSELEQPLGIVYWDRLELVAPAGWTAVPLFDDPFLGRTYEEGPRQVLPLVRLLAKNRLHMMGPQAQFHRRLTLVPARSERDARPGPFLEGLAFALREPGLWSWFKPDTARFFPQRSVLPHFGPYASSGLRGRVAIYGQLNQERDRLRRLVEKGESDGNLVDGRVLGWAHPWFIKYQGGTGGVGIQFVEGHRTAAAGSAAGYERLMLLHRMNASRQPEAAWNARGAPVGYHAWLDGEGRIPVDFRTHSRVVHPLFKLPVFGGPPASEQVLAVHAAERRPHYDLGSPHLADGKFVDQNEAVLAWQPHDGQHMVRYTKNTKALVWLGNDALARDDLILSAELFHLMFHESPAVPGTRFPGLTLFLGEKHAAEHPHQGAPIGRDQAWGIDSMCAAYSVANPAWRKRNRPWLDRMARFLLKAAMPSGILQRYGYHKILGHDRYEAAQTYEALFLLHAMRCLNESVFRDVDDELRRDLEALVRRTLDYLYWEPIYAKIPLSQPGEFFGGPRSAFAVGLPDGYREPPFSDAARWGPNYIPKDGWSGGVEFTYCWAALEYGMLISPASESPGLQNRYLRRALDCWDLFDDFESLVRRQFADATRLSNDNSANWAGFVGRLQALGVGTGSKGTDE